jgi:branched-chain amino acid transport system substrate-binding protein
MADAVRLVLDRHGYRAGRFRLAFQACDDSTAATGAYDVERCAANGKAYAANTRVVAVVGPVHSACASAMLPEVTRAGLAVVSPSATRPWLTRPSPGFPDMSGRLYPTGDHTFFRVAPPDDEQALVAIRLAQRLGVRRLFSLIEPDDYGRPIGAATRTAARTAGMRLLGPASWDAEGRRARALAREVEEAGADGAHLSGVPDLGGAQMAAALRARLGPRFPIIGSDAFALGMPPQAARAADGMWITVPGLPADRLPPAGREIVARVGAGQPGTMGPPYAAAAAELLLTAIAASDGTRADVVRRLRTARLADGPVGPMRFDSYGDPVPRHVVLYRVRGSAVLPAATG